MNKLMHCLKHSLSFIRQQFASARSKRLVVVALFIAVISVSFLWLYKVNFARGIAPELNCQNRSVEQWFSEWATNPAAHHQCAAAMRSLGPYAVPYLETVLKRNSSRSRAFYQKLTATLPRIVQRLMPMIDHDARENAELALAGLEIIGPNVKATVPVVVNALAARDKRIRDGAAAILFSWAGQAKAAVPALINLCRDNDPYVRSEAALALVQISPQEQSVLEVLRKMLLDNDVKVRELAKELSEGLLSETRRDLTPHTRDTNVD